MNPVDVTSLFTQQLTALRKQNDQLQTCLQREEEQRHQLQKQYDEYEERVIHEMEGYESQVVLLTQEVERCHGHIDQLGMPRVTG